MTYGSTDATADLPTSLSDRQGFNKRWYADYSGLTVYRPIDAAGVQSAFETIVADNSINPDQVQITGGRHCYEDFVYNSNTKAIIDMTGLKAYGEDTVNGQSAYFLDVGMGNWDMYRLLNNIYQKTCPAGSCYSVGLGGHITGGGYGVLSRLLGLTIDYLSAVDILIYTPTNGVQFIQKCSTTNYSDLFWAVRGGGGAQFGIITRYYFDVATLPDAPSYMFTTTYTWDWVDKDGKIILTQDMFNGTVNTFFFGQYCNQSENLWNIFAILHGNHKDAKTLNLVEIDTYYANSGISLKDYQGLRQERLRERTIMANEIAPLSDRDSQLVGHPYIPSTHALGVQMPEGVETSGGYGPDHIYTYLEGMQTLAPSGPNRYGKYKSAYHTQEFTTTMLEAAYAGLTETVTNPETGGTADMSSSLIQFDSYGGKINTISPTATAIPQRSSIAKLQYQSYWTTNLAPGYPDTGKQSAHVNWLNSMYTSIYTATGGIPSGPGLEGCYFNYPDVDIGSTAATTPPLSQALKLYFGDNLSDLQDAAKKYNPSGYFQNSQSLSNNN